MPLGTRSAEHLRRLELVVQHTTNMVIITNRAREIEWVNPAYTHITGWTLEEVRGKNPRSFLHGPRTSLTAATRLGALLRRGQPVQDFEMLNYKKSGEPYWVSLNIQPITDERGHISEYIAIQTDITERKRAALAAAQAYRRLAQAQRIARLGSIEHHLASGTMHCSAEVARMLEMPAEPTVMRYEEWIAGVHAEDRDPVRQGHEHAVNTSAPYEQDYRVVGRAGGVHWLRVRGVMEGWEDGRNALFRLAVQDITDRKRAEQLDREKALLERAARSQMEVLSRVSHELRTPLHAVLGFTEMVERSESGQMTPASRGHLRHIRDSARHLLLIVNDILDLARLHDRQLEFDLQPVDLLDLAQQVAAMAEPVATEHGVRVRVLPAQAGLHARADRRRLLQVLINLVANAAKYNRRGGSIELLLRPSDAQRVAIDVRDTGIGISPADQAHVFEPFFRTAGNDELSPHQSSGLGLAIARKLVRSMGGEIAVESELGAGSTFTVTLPAATPTPAPRITEAKTPRRQAAEAVRGSVLYIEDNPVNCLLIENYLAARPGVELVCCANGRDGLAAARRMNPSVMLIDMNLPDMDGHEVLRAVLADPILYRTACIAFSADDDEAVVDAAIRAGFRQYLRKPIAPADFLLALDQVLGDEPLATRF